MSPSLEEGTANRRRNRCRLGSEWASGVGETEEAARLGSPGSRWRGVDADFKWEEPPGEADR